MGEKNYKEDIIDLSIYEDLLEDRYNVEILDDVYSIKRMCGFIFLSLVIFTILMIIYAAVAGTENSATVEKISLASVFLIIGFIVLFINLIINILIIVKSAKIHSSGYTKIYGELSSFLILSIIGLFIFGTIISIIMFVISRSVARTIESDISNGEFEENPRAMFTNKSEIKNHDQISQPKKSKKERLQEALELKQSGLIDEDEYKKMKEKIILSDD